jgi:xylulokinase
MFTPTARWRPGEEDIIASLLGLDFGTGGAKACIINEGGEVRGYAFEEYPLIHDHPGWSEHDPDRYWEAGCRLIRKALQQSESVGADVKAVAVSSALPSLVMIDADGRAVERAYNLLDKRAIAEVQWLKQSVGDDRIFDVSGYRLDDHPVIVNLLWEKRHRSQSFGRVKTALTIDGFITFKLTGQRTVHVSGAAFFGVAWNMRLRRFEESILEQIGISPSLFPRVCNCDEIVGEITRQAAEATGLLAGTPVAAGQVDCNASWLGAGAIEEGDFQSNLGTVGNFGIVHRNPAYNFSPVGRLMINFPYTVDPERTFVTVPTTLTGGLCLRYLRDNFDTCGDASQARASSAYDRFNIEAERVPPGCDGLIVLPYLMGERTPIWDSQARGVVFGLSLQHARGHLVRAMMEAVAFALYDSFRLIREAGLRINYPMVLNEGGAVSRLWRRIIVDVFDVPIALAKRREGAPYGDAILAGVAARILPEYAVARQWAEYVEPMEPDPQSHAVYMEYFELYRDLYRHLKEDFQHLARLRGTAGPRCFPVS